MDHKRFFAILLLLAGALAFAYGGFEYVEEARQIKEDSLLWSPALKQPVAAPVWGGISAMLLGAFLLSLSRKQ
jgi:hypothetical protein